MKSRSQRNMRHTSKLNTTKVVRNDRLGKTKRISSNPSENILSDKSKGKMYKSINIKGQQLYVKLSTKKD